MLLGILSGGNHHSASAIVDTGSVTCGHGAVLLKCGAQLCQAFQADVAAGMLVGVKHRHALAGLDFHGDDIALAAAAVVGSDGALMAQQCQLILLLAGNIILFSQVFSGNAHMITGNSAAQAFLGQCVHQMHVAHAETGTAVHAEVRCAGHHFGADNHTQLAAIGLQAAADDIQCLHTGSALLIHSVCPSGGGNADLDLDLTAGVTAVAVLVNAAQAQLFHLLRLNACAVHGLFCHDRAQVNQRHIFQGTQKVANRSTCIANNHNVFIIQCHFLYLRIFRHSPAVLRVHVHFNHTSLVLSTQKCCYSLKSAVFTIYPDFYCEIFNVKSLTICKKIEFLLLAFFSRLHFMRKGDSFFRFHCTNVNIL